MLEDDNLTAVAGEAAGNNANPSEEAAKSADAGKAAPEKDKEAPPTEEGAAKERSSEEAGDDAGDKPKKPSGSARKAERIRELEAQVAELKARAAAPAENAPPKLEDFPDWDAYEAAKIEWATSRAIEKARQSDAKAELGRTQEAYAAEVIGAHAARLSEARERIPDFDKTLASYKGPPVSTAVQELVLQSDKSELVTFHIATRPELVRELNNLDPVSAARRIGQLEARLSYPAAKTTSDAPAPVGGVKGGASPVFDPAKASYAEYKAWRERGGKFG